MSASRRLAVATQGFRGGNEQSTVDANVFGAVGAVEVRAVVGSVAISGVVNTPESTGAVEIQNIPATVDPNVVEGDV